MNNEELPFGWFTLRMVLQRCFARCVYLRFAGCMRLCYACRRYDFASLVVIYNNGEGLFFTTFRKCICEANKGERGCNEIEFGFSTISTDRWCRFALSFFEGLDTCRAWSRMEMLHCSGIVTSKMIVKPNSISYDL